MMVKALCRIRVEISRLRFYPTWKRVQVTPVSLPSFPILTIEPAKSSIFQWFHQVLLLLLLVLVLVLVAVGAMMTTMISVLKPPREDWEERDMDIIHIIHVNYV